MVSQLLTLYITPVIYVYMERFRRTSKKPKRGTQHDIEFHEPAGALGD